MDPFLIFCVDSFIPELYQKANPDRPPATSEYLNKMVYVMKTDKDINSVINKTKAILESHDAENKLLHTVHKLILTQKK